MDNFGFYAAERRKNSYQVQTQLDIKWYLKEDCQTGISTNSVNLTFIMSNIKYTVQYKLL